MQILKPTSKEKFHQQQFGLESELFGIKCRNYTKKQNTEGHGGTIQIPGLIKTAFKDNQDGWHLHLNNSLPLTKLSDLIFA